MVKMAVLVHRVNMAHWANTVSGTGFRCVIARTVIMVTIMVTIMVMGFWYVGPVFRTLCEPSVEPGGQMLFQQHDRDDPDQNPDKCLVSEHLAGRRQHLKTQGCQ
jgi:hypothetical protein